jgi:hypothetical protein
MDNAHFWFQEGPGGGGGDPGDPIGESLRFRGAAHLSNSTISCPTTFTYSGWVKLADFTAGEWVTLFNQNNDPGSGNGPSFGTNFNDTIRYYSAHNNVINSTARFRDPSAWYNVVLQQTATDFTVWVNGEQVLQNARALGANSGNFEIHRSFDGTNLAERDCYMADVYFIDGQALEPTAFGRYNDDGVWVPVAPTGLTYGSNGFHLTFDPTQDPDPQVAIGMDSSGNNNHFTATGFNTDPVGVFSSFLFADMSGGATPDLSTTDRAPIEVASDSTASNAFDGNTGTRAYINNGANNWLIWNPPNPIAVGSGLRLFTQGDSVAALWINGAPVTAPTGDPQWNTITLNAGTTEIESIALRGSAGSAPLHAVEINGAVLVDNTGTDYDLMQDSPTQNYATINPLYPGASTSKANLTTANTTGKPTILGTAGDVGVDGASVAWDGTEAGWTSTGAINFGQQPSGFDEFSTRTMPAATIANGRDHFQAITGPGSGEENVAADQIGGDFSSEVTTADGGGWNGDRTPDKMFLANVAPSTGEAMVAKHGDAIVFKPVPVIDYTTSVEVFTNMSTNNGTIYLNDPAESGPGVGTVAANWAVIGTGAGTITEIRIRSGSERANCCAIRVDGKILVDLSILALAQNTFPDGLWWIKDRVNSNQHQLVDSIDGTTSCRQLNAGTTGAYVAPAGDSVAWCWNWNQADPQANGFNIVEFNASGDTTIDTGLTNPEFLFYYSTISTKTFAGLRLLGNGFFELNDSQQFVSGGTIQWQTGASAGEVIFDGSRIGGAGKLFAWQSVPGYSAFGSFQGNSNADGPFVYLGFKPQMLMIRTTGAGDSFFMLDSTRGRNNPIGVDVFLNAGSTDPEGTWSARDIDFLSNGFKIRSNSGSINGGTVVYCAWAENPFQAPVTAR